MSEIQGIPNTNSFPTPANTPSEIPQTNLTDSVADLIGMSMVPFPLNLNEGTSNTAPAPVPSTASAPTNRKMKKNGKDKSTFLCPISGCSYECYEFPTRASYINHLEVHEGKKPFVCPICYWGYETDMQLLEHSVRHTNEPICRCGGCGKQYKTIRGLKNHKLLKACNTPRPSRLSKNQKEK